MIKIAFTGPESSGKTTLCKALADELKCLWISEYAREYLENKNNYEMSDLDVMALEQVLKWDAIKNQPLILCDTEMLVYKIWSEVKFGKLSETIKQLYEAQYFDFYFLCKPDIPWQPDPMRENENNRDELFELYSAELIATHRPYKILTGSLENRIGQVKKTIAELL